MPYKDPIVDREYHKAYKKRYNKTYPERVRDHDRVRHANRRAALYGCVGRITILDVRAVKSAGRCFYCGALSGSGKIPDLGIDHVIPLHAGGPNTRDNIVCCCHPCNASKYRNDKPGRWARDWDSCASCGTSERKHCARGMCNACYIRTYK